MHKSLIETEYMLKVSLKATAGYFLGLLLLIIINKREGKDKLNRKQDVKIFFTLFVIFLYLYTKCIQIYIFKNFSASKR